MTAGDLIAAIAGGEYDRRSTNAKRLVEQGRLSAAAAQREMLPWTAIALICRAPGVLDDEVTAARRTIVHYPGSGARAVYGHLLPEDDARIILADEYCRAPIWRAALAKARDAALGKANTPERIERARNLCILARAMDVPLTAASCARPAQPERKAA